jgi:hypothetical protein
VSGGSGNPTPTGSVTLTSGSYTSAATTLNGGSATIEISAGTLAANTDTLTASYTPDSGSSATYDSTTGSSLVTVFKDASEISWTPATTIIYGSSGTNVLNASSTVSGGFVYTATPTAGTPSTSPITSTASLFVNDVTLVSSYIVAADFTPVDTTDYSPASDSITLTVSGESVWIVDGSGGTSELAGNGYGITSSADSAANTAAAIDNAGNVWTVGSGSPLLEETSQTGTVQHSASSGGGIDAPAGIAIDGNNQIWTTNGNNSVSLFSDAGTPVSPSAGFTDSSLSTPGGIAVDLAGSVWIANKTNNSVTRILGAAGPAAPPSNNSPGAKP